MIKDSEIGVAGQKLGKEREKRKKNKEEKKKNWVDECKSERENVTKRAKDAVGAEALHH